MKKAVLWILIFTFLFTVFAANTAFAASSVSPPWLLAGYQAGTFGTASWTSTDASTISGSYFNGGAETAAPGSVALQASPYKDGYTVSTDMKLTESDTFEWQRMSLVFWYKDDANYLMATINHHSSWGETCQAMIFGFLNGNWMTIAGQPVPGWWYLGTIPNAFSSDNTLSVTKNGQVLNLNFNSLSYRFDFDTTSYDITGDTAYVGVAVWSTAVDFSDFSVSETEEEPEVPEKTPLDDSWTASESFWFMRDDRIVGDGYLAGTWTTALTECPYTDNYEISVNMKKTDRLGVYNSDLHAYGNQIGIVAWYVDANNYIYCTLDQWNLSPQATPVIWGYIGGTRITTTMLDEYKHTADNIWIIGDPVPGTIYLKNNFTVKRHGRVFEIWFEGKKAMSITIPETVVYEGTEITFDMSAERFRTGLVTLGAEVEFTDFGICEYREPEPEPEDPGETDNPGGGENEPETEGSIFDVAGGVGGSVVILLVTVLSAIILTKKY